MIKLIYCINRLPTLSVREFQDYWFKTHGPIAGAIKGVKRYVQCHTLPETYNGGQSPPFDGCAQLWWSSPEAMAADSGSTEVRAALEDEKKFIDHGRVAMFVTREHEIMEGREEAGGLVKMIVCAQPRDDFDGDLTDYWLNKHAPLVAKLPGLRKYTVCLAEATEAIPAPQFQGAAELYFDSLDAARAGFASDEGKAAAEDTAKFLDPATLRVFYTRERPVVEGR